MNKCDLMYQQITNSVYQACLLISVFGACLLSCRLGDINKRG